MAEIKLLENSMINKIAAGEVVERPASVVKELVENSVDAGARAVTVEIKDGGIELVRVSDNGCGIPREQVRQAFLRHATSKISNLEDLENVLTLGFRGEALSSISSVSQVELITKTTDSLTGTRIEINGGEVIFEGEAGCTDGTSFIMRNLFYNTPARRKFLKKPSTESGYIADIITKMALGHPEVAFKYINNSSVLIQTNGNNDLKTASFQIYGKDFAQKMIPLQYEKSGFVISGLIGKPELARANRTYENFFINGRFVKSDIVQSAVEEAYKTRLPIGKFPVFILHLKAAPDFVDVNVHPTKLEVRFSDEDLIYSIVNEAVEKTFKGENLIPKQQISEPKKSFSAVYQNEVYTAEQSTIPFDSPKIVVSEETTPYIVSDVTADLPPVTYINFSDSDFKAVEPIEEVFEPLEEPKRPFFHNYRIIGQIFNTYWIIEQDGSMYMIDQHAAHERALYEDITAKLKKGEIIPQRLVAPIAVNLSHHEKQVVTDNFALLESFGFEMEEFGEASFAIRSVPYIFSSPADSNFFLEIIDKLLEKEKSVDNIYDSSDHAIATIACKAAVKGHDKLSYIEAKTLIEKILKLENPFTCPHGRPTVIEITKYEIEKMFKRVQ